MPSIRIVGVLSLILVFTQAGTMTFPALLPQLMSEWRLSESEAGWISGMFFAGYALSVPILASLADRVDARPIVVVSSLVASLSAVAFAFWAEGFWFAMLMRLLTGIGVAGVHMPGLTLLAERLDGDARRRGSAIYAACFALGTAFSFMIAGVVASAYGWRGAFIVSGVAPLLVLPLVALVGPPRAETVRAAAGNTALLDFRPVMGNRGALAYVIAYAGNTWEVFGVRTWLVAFIAFSQGLPGNAGSEWNGAVLSSVAAFLGVPAGIILAEVAIRRDRRIVIAATAALSVVVALAIAGLVEAATPVVVGLLVLHGMVSYGDAPSISSGVVEAAKDEARGATLAVFALAGFVSGFISPLVIGVTLEAAGGVASARAWMLAFGVIGLGSVVAAFAMRFAERPTPRQGTSRAFEPTG